MAHQPRLSPKPLSPLRAAARRALALSAAALAALASSACASGDPAGGSVAGADERLGAVAQAVETQGDWAQYGSGQCVSGARTFYTNHFGVTLKATGVQGSSIGACEYLGACMYWVSGAAQPDPGTWDKHPWGSAMPQTYDLVIYPPTSTNPYGHVASIDHMEGGDASAYGNLYIMDSNFNGNEQKASAIHTFNRQPYGFYRLKALAGCSAHCDGNTLVGGQCEKTDCGASQSSCVQDGLGPRCVYSACPAVGDAAVCVPGSQTIATCHDGAVTGKTDCAAADKVCSATGELHCDAPPRGNLDAAGCQLITGWAQDPSKAEAGIDVHVYFGGPAGDPAAAAVAVAAADHRDDLCAAIGSCAHGFSLRTPRSLLDGQPHPVWAYGIDQSGGPNAQLGDAPLMFQCPMEAPKPPAQLRRVLGDASFATWKFSEFLDVAPVPDDPERFSDGAPGRGPDLPASPALVQADDGTSQRWLIDSGVRRRVPGDAAAAWRLGEPELWPAPSLYQVPVGADLPPAPALVLGPGPAYFLVDTAFLPGEPAEGVPQGNTPPPAATGTGAPPAPTTTAPPKQQPPASTPGPTSVSATGGEQEAGMSCAVSRARLGAPSPAGGGWLLGLGAGLALAASRLALAASRRARRPSALRPARRRAPKSARA
jgi:hypothetical protein